MVQRTAGKQYISKVLRELELGKVASFTDTVEIIPERPAERTITIKLVVAAPDQKDPA